MFRYQQFLYKNQLWTFRKIRISPCCQAAKQKRTNKKPTHCRLRLPSWTRIKMARWIVYRDRWKFSRWEFFSAKKLLHVWLFWGLHPLKFSSSPLKHDDGWKITFLSFWGPGNYFLGRAVKFPGYPKEKAKNKSGGIFDFGGRPIDIFLSQPNRRLFIYQL